MIRLWLLLMFACCFTLATLLEPRFEELRLKSTTAKSVLEALLGDSRRLFANHFYAKADAYLHSGFYPTIFDAPQSEEESHLTVHGEEEENEHGNAQDHAHGAQHHPENSSFLGPPVDWIERFGRNFIPNVHTHLEGANAREILPWLRLSADLDPKRIETYVTAAYWLRARMNKPLEAEAFLREGLKENPDSYEILFELGKIYNFDKKQPQVARTLYTLALGKWRQQERQGFKPEPHTYVEILGEMVRVDKEQNNLKNWLADLEELVKVTANKEAVQKSIEEVKSKMQAN